MLGCEGGDTWNFGDKAVRAAKPQGRQRMENDSSPCTGRSQPEDTSQTTCSQACRRARGQVSGGHLAAAPGTVCSQPVSTAGPQIPHSPACRGVVSAWVGVVFTDNPRCDDGPCPAPPEEEPAQKKEPAGICSAPYKLPWLGERRDLCEQKHS